VSAVVSAFYDLRAANDEEQARSMSLQSGLQALRSSVISIVGDDPASDEADDLSYDVGRISSTVDSLRRNNAALRARIGELANALAYTRAEIDPTGSGPVADGGLDSLDLESISSTVSLLREDGAALRLHNEELEQALVSLRSLIVGDDEVEPVDCASKVDDIVSAYTRLRDDHVARGARIRELEGSMQLLRSSVLEKDEEGFDYASDVTDVLSVVASLRAENNGQRSRIAELEAGFVSLRSSIVGGDIGGAVNCAADVNEISSAVSALREDNGRYEARTSELESALRSVQASVLQDHSPKALTVGGLDASVVCSSISSKVSSLREELSQQKSRIVVLENAFRALRVHILGRMSGDFDVDRPIDTDVELRDLSVVIIRLRRRIETQVTQLRQLRDCIKMLNDNIMEVAGIEPDPSESSGAMDVGTISNVVAQLREANTRLQARSGELEGLLRMTQKENASRATRLSQMEEAMKTLRKDNLSRKTEAVELQSSLRSAQRESAERAKRVSDLQVVAKQLDRESADRLSRVTELEARLRLVEQENNSRGSHLCQVESALRSLCSRLITGPGAEIWRNAGAPGLALCDAISSAVDALRDENGTQQLRISELELSMKSLRLLILRGDETAAVKSESCTSSSASTAASLCEDMAAWQSRVSELESALKSLRSTIVGGDGTESIDVVSDVSTISSTVSGLRSRVSELESALKSLRSTIVDSEAGSIDPTPAVSATSTALSDLQSDMPCEIQIPQVIEPAVHRVDGLPP
jgi:chromosome segregation ATPase